MTMHEPPQNQSQIDFMKSIDDNAFKNEDGYFIIGARFKLSFNEAGGITIDEMRVPEKLRHSKKRDFQKKRQISLSDFGLEQITSTADRFQIPLYVYVVPLGDVPQPKLHEIYARHGFKGNGGMEVVRLPRDYGNRIRLKVA